ncbi:hypothetical protein Tco_0549232 [Tanacetum coccineum]
MITYQKLTETRWWKHYLKRKGPATHEHAWTIPSYNVMILRQLGRHSPSVPDGVSQDAHSSGHVTSQPRFFFNKDLEYLRYGSKGSNPALSISKMKAASYPDFGLELLVPEQMWIDDVCTYDISAKYGISHWWFNRQKFFLQGMILRIVLRIADFQEHTIAERDFKNLYPSDFEDLNLLLLQGHLDHLPGSDKWMLYS